MRRFKVKDLIISPVPQLADAPVPPRNCKQEPGTGPCLKGSPNTNGKYCKWDEKGEKETKVPCGNHTDTTVPCIEDMHTFPCMRESTQFEETDCADLPGNAHDTEYFCIKPEGEETTVPCWDKSNTKLPGMPSAPKQGCLVGSRTGKRCAEQKGFETRYPCFGTETKYACKPPNSEVACALMPGYKDECQTKYVCMEGSNTEKPCWRQSETKLECATGSNTAHGCYRDPRYPKEDTRIWCAENPPAARTKQPCQDKQTGYSGCSNGFTEYCGWLTASWDYPEPATAKLPVNAAGVFACPPLSPLQQPADAPAVLDDLAGLRRDLKVALGLVEVREREIEALLEPHTKAEAAQLAKTLEAALIRVRELAQTLTDEPRRASQEPTDKPKPPQKPAK